MIGAELYGPPVVAETAKLELKSGYALFYPIILHF